MDLNKLKDLIEKGAELDGVSPGGFGRKATRGEKGAGNSRFYDNLLRDIAYYEEKYTQARSCYKDVKKARGK